MALSPPQTRGTLSAPTTVEPKPTRRSGQIAIDGRGASLKSPLGLALAQGLGFTFVDAGSIFRFAALLSHMDRLNLRRRDHRTILLRRLARRHFDFDDDGALLVDGQRHDGVLQTPAIERSVARVAAYVEVQSQVNGIVRALIPRHGVVVVGRHPTPTLLDRCTWLICVSDNPDTRAQRLGQRSGLSVGQAQRCLRDRDRRDHRRSGGAWQADRYLELRLDEDSMQRQVSRLIQQWRRR